MKQSRKKTVLICLECGKEIIGGAHLSRHVQKEHGFESYEAYKIKHGLVKTREELVNEGAVECKLCGLLAHDLTSHILRIHKCDIEDYKREFGDTRSERFLREQSERIMGDKNPAYDHQGKFSPLSDKFIHKDKIDKDDVKKKISQSNKNNGNNSTTLSYWIKKGYTEDEAAKKLSERQKTFSLTKCVEKHGKSDGVMVWNKRQKKWLNSLKKSNAKRFSNISQELFWSIFPHLDQDALQHTYFAELGPDKKADKSGKNNEYVLNLTEKHIMPDFINMKTKKIIEFDGTYWHGSHLLRTQDELRDQKRDAALKREGYTVLHIKEDDYRKSPQEAIKNCITFLNG